MRKKNLSPVVMTVLSGFCAVIWMSMALTRWKEDPMALAAGAVWLLNFALWSFRAYRTKRKNREEP